MEQRNNLVLQGTETFSRGQLDNLALENGALVLDSVAGRSLLYGSYTTPEFAMPAFCNLNVSWNAHAPRDTMVEVRCRVYAAGAWTSWMSFGKWAPDYPRCSVSSQSEDGMIFLMGDTVTVAFPHRVSPLQCDLSLSMITVEINIKDVGVKRHFDPSDTRLLRTICSRNLQKHS